MASAVRPLPPKSDRSPRRPRRRPSNPVSYHKRTDNPSFNEFAQVVDAFDRQRCQRAKEFVVLVHKSMLCTSAAVSKALLQAADALLLSAGPAWQFNTYLPVVLAYARSKHFHNLLSQIPAATVERQTCIRAGAYMLLAFIGRTAETGDIFRVVEAHAGHALTRKAVDALLRRNSGMGSVST